jgi:predicted dehydrogenase
MKRRNFLKASAAGLTILPSGILKAGNSPNEKLNIAVIGVANRGGANLNGVKSENIVALCDVNRNHLGAASKRFPRAKTYEDWRLCLEQKDIDAVVCSTTDQTHAFVNIWAMNRGKHVYSEKPLANCVAEAQLVRKTYLDNKDKLATQMGTQIHASDNYRRVRELIRSGAIGEPISARAWVDRMPTTANYLPESGPVPGWINWDLWIGPAPMHPFNEGYFKNGCLTWNQYWDFGSGQIGDMASHLMDLAYYGFDLGLPTTCKAEGSDYHPDTCPIWLTAKWNHPATDWRPAVEVFWYDGGKKPGMPLKIFDRDQMGKGVIFKGTEGYLIADYNMRILIPKGNLTYYTAPKNEEELIPSSIGHHEEWIQACKTDKKTSCNFDYAGKIIENNMLALVAYRCGKEISWDTEKMMSPDTPEAAQYISKTYRDGWVLNG